MRRILHVSFSTSGGAGIVAAQLQNEQRHRNIDSTFFSLTDGDIKSMGLRKPLLVLLALIDYYIVKKRSSPSLFTLFRSRSYGKQFVGKELSRSLIHLHWTPGVLSRREIQSMSDSDIPIVWTLHDMWPFTGGCHQSLECTQYKKTCERCPQVRRLFRPLVRLQHRKKLRLIESSRYLQFVAPSQWIMNQLLESSVPIYRKPVLIPNPVDTEVFTPRSTGRAKTEKFNIGIVAKNLDDPIKNVKATISKLQNWIENSDIKNIKITVVGNSSTSFKSRRVEIQLIPFISNRLAMAEIYKTFDVLIHNSLSDNSPLVVQEALSCGVPVICGTAGGARFLIQDSLNGFVFADFEEAAKWTLKLKNDVDSHRQMKNAARRHAVANFSLQSLIDKYEKVYSSFDNLDD